MLHQAPVLADHLRVAEAAQGRQQHAQAAGQAAQAVHQGAGHMEDRQAVERHIPGTCSHACAVGAGGGHQIGMGLPGQLGQAGGATGVEVGGDIPGPGQQLAFQGLAAVSRQQAVVVRFATLDQHRQASGPLRQAPRRGQGLLPEVAARHRTEDDQQVGAGLFHQAGQGLFAQQRVDRVGDADTGGGPEQALALRNVRQQQGDHRLAGAGQVEQQSRAAVELGEELRVAEVLLVDLRAQAVDIGQGDTPGMLGRRGLQEFIDGGWSLGGHGGLLGPARCCAPILGGQGGGGINKC
ncbi:hypothetical protein D3C84_646990 [compost metagenome]